MAYEEPKRKSAAEIRNLIMKKLRMRPQTTTELSRNIGADTGTIGKHLAWLEHIGVVSSYTTVWKDKEKRLWRLER